MDTQRLESILSKGNFVVVAPSFVFSGKLRELGDILHNIDRPQALSKHTHSFAQLNDVFQSLLVLFMRYSNVYTITECNGTLVYQSSHFLRCADFQESRINRELTKARKGVNFRCRNYRARPMESLHRDVIDSPLEDLAYELRYPIDQIRTLAGTMQQLADSMLVSESLTLPYTPVISGAIAIKVLFGLLMGHSNCDRVGYVLTRNPNTLEAFQKLLELPPYSGYPELVNRAAIEVFSKFLPRV